MPDRENPQEEARRLSQMLIHVADKAKQDFASSAAECGLPVHLARAVLMLDHPAPMRDLAERLACDRSYITNLADSMEARGLVTRVPGKDRRVKLLQLTASGKALRQQLSADVGRRALVLRRLSDAERRTLEPLLERLLGDDELT
jgi:DNA-binding MarR family transcriptional regulator